MPLIEAVVFSGGEPLLQEQPLIDISRWAKGKGLSIGIETNGTQPMILKSILKQNVVDFVAMDIKTIFREYEKVVQTDGNVAERVYESVKLIKSSIVQHEFRTTFIPKLVDIRTAKSLMRIVCGEKWAWQRFRYDLGGVLDNELLGREFTNHEKEDFESLSRKQRNVILRF